MWVPTTNSPFIPVAHADNTGALSSKLILLFLFPTDDNWQCLEIILMTVTDSVTGIWSYNGYHSYLLLIQNLSGSAVEKCCMNPISSNYWP